MDATNKELSLNKLIILYMLDMVNTPMNNTQLSDFIINSGYTNYFSLQEYLSQMIETDLLKVSIIKHNTFYSLTKSGKTTLGYFENRIPQDTKDEIKTYLEEKKLEIKSTYEINADYIPGIHNDYLVHCYAKDKGVLIVELKITVYDKQSAITLCENWQNNNQKIFKNILTSMMS